jgi:retinol dehydrogenase-12
MQCIEKKTGNAKMYFIPLDLADLNSVVECAKKFKNMKMPLHVLINNGGCMIDPSQKKSTKNGYEIMFGTNYLGHFLLNHLLLDEIIKTKGRIVQVASVAHHYYKDYPKKSFLERIKHPLCDNSLLPQYGFSKTCTMAFVKSLHEKLIGKGVLVNCCHPGIFPYLELIKLN